MTADSLVFDRVEVESVTHTGVTPDGDSFAVKVRNAGDGRPETSVIRTEASGSATALLQARGSSVADWLAANVTMTANAHQNDGFKVRALMAAAPLRYDSRYVLD